MIYEPNEDSYLIEKEVKKYAKGKKILDMGSGSGILAQAAIDAGAKEVLAADVDSESLRHLRKLGIPTKKSNLFDNIEGKFEMIIFNPPYLPEDNNEDFESKRATTGGKKGDEIILNFLKKADKFLNNDGIILLLLSSLTPRNKINKLIEKKKYKIEILTKKKLFFEILEVCKLERKA